MRTAVVIAQHKGQHLAQRPAVQLAENGHRQAMLTVRQVTWLFSKLIKIAHVIRNEKGQYLMRIDSLIMDDGECYMTPIWGEKRNAILFDTETYCNPLGEEKSVAQVMRDNNIDEVATIKRVFIAPNKTTVGFKTPSESYGTTHFASDY